MIIKRFMSTNRKKIIVLLFLLVFCLGFLFFNNDKNYYVDDYYEAVNEDTLSVNHLKDGSYNWSNFTKMQEQADDDMDLLLESILDNNNTYGEYANLSKIRVVYDNFIDIEKRRLDGLGVLSVYLDKLNMVSDISNLIEVIALIERDLDIPILTNITIESDFEDNKVNMVYLYPVTFAFGTSVDYYVNDDYMLYKAYLKRAMIQLLEVYGCSKKEARNISSDLMLFYEDIGKSSKSMLELSDVGSYFEKISKEQLQDIYSNLLVDDYLDNHDISSQKIYSMVDKSQYEKLNTYLDNKYLDLWKNHLLVLILSCYANYLDSNYEQIVLNLNQAITGSNNIKTREENSRDLIVSLFSREIDFFYEDEVVSDDIRKYLYGMFDDIKDVYREMLMTNVWLSHDTINTAIEKLDNMKFYVGLDSVEKDFSSLDEMNLLSFKENGSLLLNVLEVIRVRKETELERLNNNNDVRVVGESVVNAYYSPMNNAIYIPSAAVFMMDLNDSYYENLGKIGFVIAHEMTHGFDLNGSQFDLNGNFKNWWLEEDRKNFSLLKEKVISYYNKYEVLDGRFLNGELTVNENIADLGAIRCISLVLDKRNATTNEKKEMYSSFAKFWVSQSNDEYLKLLLLQDSHAPNKYRVNAVLSSLDDFYDLYNVFFWNEMFVKKEDRVQVW